MLMIDHVIWNLIGDLLETFEPDLMSFKAPVNQKLITDLGKYFKLKSHDYETKESELMHLFILSNETDKDFKKVLLDLDYEAIGFEYRLLEFIIRYIASGDLEHALSKFK